MKLTVALIVALLIPTSAFSQASNNVPSLASHDEQELRALVKNWNEAESKGDYAYIANLLSDEFSFLDGVNKKQYLNLTGANDGILRVDFSTIEKIDVNIYGNAAIVTTLNSFKEKVNRERFPTNKFWFMTVWVKTRGQWKCVKAAENAVEKDGQAASNNTLKPTANQLVLYPQRLQAAA